MKIEIFSIRLKLLRDFSSLLDMDKDLQAFFLSVLDDFAANIHIRLTSG